MSSAKASAWPPSMSSARRPKRCGVEGSDVPGRRRDDRDEAREDYEEKRLDGVEPEVERGADEPEDRRLEHPDEEGGAGEHDPGRGS